MVVHMDPVYIFVVGYYSKWRDIFDVIKVMKQGSKRGGKC